MIDIRLADPAASDLRSLIDANLVHGAGAAPAESDHTFGVDQLRGRDVRFWAAYDGATAVGCGALKSLSDGTAEVKSVYVSTAARGRGIARQIMQHLATAAQTTGITALVLETGSDLLPEYDAARALYERLGYIYCPPILGYEEDPNSAFMRLDLTSGD
ncbi:GNAT family N-acetyltransferase [Aliisedimentitalea scapharcae]|uniref:GNAT family N-acetyltransferase n=1 Tax=Aliisedimentitalea scapharcae TaxID=1524259 RepID=A0ABZ2XQL7_9RHOB